MVEAGQTFEQDGVVVRIVEVAPHFSASHRRKLLIGYEIIEGDVTSNVAHIIMFKHEKLGDKIKEAVTHYKKVKRK